MKLNLLPVAALLSVLSISTVAETGCIDADIISGKMITDVCWDCIFPMRVAGVSIGGSGTGAPHQSYNSPLCSCSDDLGVPRPGVTTSYWEPARLIEFQRTPGCSSVFNGMRFPFDRVQQGHHQQGGDDGSTGRFLHYHFYAFPLLAILDLFSNAGCGVDGYMDLDMMFMSELDPTWNDDSLAFFTNPEASFTSDPLMVAMCSLDAAAVEVDQPIPEMFWCAGSWGSIYPASGNTYGHGSIPKDTSLFTTRVLTALHRRGITHRSMGEDAMCYGQIEPTLPKQMYKFTLLHPIAETDKAHWIGQSEYTWGLGKTIPSVGEDLIYTIWRWNDCCLIDSDG